MAGDVWVNSNSSPGYFDAKMYCVETGEISINLLLLHDALLGRFQDFFQGWQRYLQGVAKISKGVAKKLRAIPFLSAFFAV